MSQSEFLEQCPKCHKSAVLRDNWKGFTGDWNWHPNDLRYRVVCLECGLATPEFCVKDDAVKDWNNRPAKIYKELDRQFQPNGPAGPDEAQLMEIYRIIGMDPVYDEFTRKASMMRYNAIRNKFRLQPKKF